jgi:hypothetical protein
MNDLVQLNLSMNGYLFGCLVLLAMWLTTWVALRVARMTDQIPEFWWASIACGLLGITEPLFVPEYWDPPSILKVGRWDLESFLFCFAIGGVAAVVTEIGPVKNLLVLADAYIEKAIRFVLAAISKLSRGILHSSMLDRPMTSRLISPEQTRIENMLLVTFFFAALGATAHFGLNIIYDSAIVCVASAVMVAWRRPSLRWQILGGGVSFMLLYGIVLLIVDRAYPDFYNHWNLGALSGFRILGAPAEEYLFAFTFGVMWAPFYEAWKESE